MEALLEFIIVDGWMFHCSLVLAQERLYAAVMDWTNWYLYEIT